MPSTLFYKSKPPHAIYFTTSIFIQNQAIYFLNDDIGRAEKRKTFQVGLPCIYATCCVGSLYHWRLHSKILFIFMWYQFGSGSDVLKNAFFRVDRSTASLNHRQNICIKEFALYNIMWCVSHQSVIQRIGLFVKRPYMKVNTQFMRTKYIQRYTNIYLQHKLFTNFKITCRR